MKSILPLLFALLCSCFTESVDAQVKDSPSATPGADLLRQHKIQTAQKIKQNGISMLIGGGVFLTAAIVLQTSTPVTDVSGQRSSYHLFGDGLIIVGAPLSLIGAITTLTGYTREQEVLKKSSQSYIGYYEDAYSKGLRLCFSL